MQNSPPLFLLLLLLAGIFGGAVVVAGIRLHSAAFSRGITLAAVLPALAMLALFHSLAIHMHQSLGGWPTSYGTGGFPSPLTTHAGIAARYFSVLLLICILVLPIAVVLCAFIRRWRGALFYLGVFAISCLVSFAGMLLAPSEFLKWWWD